MDIFSTIKQVITDPMNFFDDLDNEPAWQPYLYFTILAIPFVILSLLATFLFTFITRTSLPTYLSLLPIPKAVAAVLFVLAYYVAIHIGYWIGTLIMHVIFLCFGCKGDLRNTMQIISYAGTPRLLLGWIPFVNWIAAIWSVVLLFIAAMKVHKLSVARTIFAAIVIPLILGLAFGAAIAFLFVTAYSGAFS